MKAYSKGLTECLNYMEIANHFYFDPLKANIEKDRERIKLTAAINLQKSFCFWNCFLAINDDNLTAS